MRQPARKRCRCSGVSLLDSGNLTSLNGYNFGVLGGFSTSSTLTVNSNLNTSGQTAVQRGYSFSFTVPASFILGKLTIRAGHVSGAGAKQVYVSTLNYRIVRISDSAVISSGSQSFDHAGTEVFFDRVFTLSGDMQAGVSYRLEIGMNNLASGGAFAIYDGVNLEAYPEPSSTPSFAQRLNYAKYQKITANVVNATYVADYAVDGIVSNFHGWRVGGNTGPHWLELTYPRPVTLGSAHLYSGILLGTTSQVWANFRFQYHNGSAWMDIPGSTVTGNTAAERSVLFSTPVTATRFRLQGNEAVGSRTVRELAFFPPNPGAGGVEQGYPLGTDVVVNLAHERPTIASSINGTSYAHLATDGFVADASRWLCEGTTPGQTLEIDLLADHGVGSAHVHSGHFGTSTQALANFTLESWNSTTSTWQAIPGATITGNTELSRVVAFGSTVNTSKIRLVIPDASVANVAELQLFPPRSGGYPLGQNIRYEAPPAAKWDDFSDDTRRIRIQPTPDRRLALIDGAAIFTDNSAGATALDWQLLLNYRDGSYRIRHAATGLCLGLSAISTAANTAVIGEQYTGLPHQDWFLDYVSPTKFRILNAYSGLALQSLGGSQTIGTPLVVTTPGVSQLQRWDTQRQKHHPKKGIAATGNVISTSSNPYSTDPDLTFHEDFYNKLGGFWSYGWGRQTSDTFPYLSTDHAYNPMQWGDFNWIHGTTTSAAGPIDRIRRDMQSNPKPVHLMAFNEPDKESQGFITPADAIMRWPRLEAMQAPIVAPVPASIQVNSTTSPATPAAGWLGDFTAQADALGYRRDYTSVHWYAAPNSDSLIGVLQSIYEAYGRPVWLTEFSTVDWNQTSSWTDADNFNFLAEFMWRAESISWLKRYSIFSFIKGPTDNPNQGAPDPAAAPRSNTFNADGTLTPFGQLYAGWDGVTGIQTDRAYHLHSHGNYRRAQNTGSGSAVSSVVPSSTVLGQQWFLSPGVTANTFRILSTRDGRPLRFVDGGSVTLGTAGETGAAVEWSFVAETNGYGRYYIQHPASANKRLRLNANGTYSMVVATDTNNLSKWRLVRPAVSDAAGAPAAPAALTATPSPSEITLSWPASALATGYSVFRATNSAGPWSQLAGDLTGTSYADTGAVQGTTYFYQVTATNLYALSSAPSPVASATLLPPPDPFAAWVDEKLSARPAADQLPAADPDGDGLPNLLEYALALEPLVASPSHPQPQVAGARLRLTFLRARAELTYEVLASSTLAPDSWTVIATNPGTVSLTAPVTVDDTVLVSENPRRFLRLRVTQ